MARVGPAGRRFSTSYYKDYPLPNDKFLQKFKSGLPWEEVRLRTATLYRGGESFSVPPVDIDSKLNIARNKRRVANCQTCDDTPYACYTPVPVTKNYETRSSGVADCRNRTDWITLWNDQKILQDRAFDEWHHFYGAKYGYGDDRRL